MSLVGLGALALALPTVLAVVTLPADAIGYVATARNWIEGRGFVDPIVYSYYLPGASSPIPAIAVRPPIVPILFALPLYLGAGLVGLGVLHALWSAWVGASILWVGRRFMSLPAATAAAIGVAWSHNWWRSSTQLLTETTSVGAMLALLAVTPRALRTPWGAAGLAVATLIAWLVRPNLAGFTAVVVVAAVWSWGARSAFRSRPLWTYLVVFVLLQQVTGVLLSAIHGFAPYAHYGVMAETLSTIDVRSYQAEYGGALDHAVRHAGEIASILVANLRATATQLLFRPDYLFVGWLVLPGVVYGLSRRSEEGLLPALCTFAALAFMTIGILTGWGYDVTRYPLLGVTCFWLLGFASIDAAVQRFLDRRAERGKPAPAYLRGAPLAMMLLACLAIIPRTETWVFVNRHLEVKHPVPRLQGPPGSNRVSLAFCPRMHADAIVTSPDPWSIYYWCGNAGYLIPRDLSDLHWLHAYLDEMKPGYLITELATEQAVFDRSPRLVSVDRFADIRLYEVRGAGSDGWPWHSIGPLADIGPPRRSTRGVQNRPPR
ncbi:MAG: hypothetical protein GY723_06965 [bacterium]|nr:hypothetical protein [bacterium]MCP5069815.1 hypothetical protein [bacterium]